MSREIRHFVFTIPANTPQSAPFIQDWTFPPREVTQINWRVPPGPAGNMGFAVGSAGTPVIPADAGAWIVTDDEYVEWPLSGFWDSGSWEFRGYNTGAFSHAVYFTFMCDLPGGQSSTTPPLIPSSALSSPPPSIIPAPATALSAEAGGTSGSPPQIFVVPGSLVGVALPPAPTITTPTLETTAPPAPPSVGGG